MATRKTVTLGIAASAVAATTIPTLRSALSKVLGLNAPGGFWRLFAIVLALANVKNLPFVWHVREDPIGLH
jgi:hypothetical protein